MFYDAQNNTTTRQPVGKCIFSLATVGCQWIANQSLGVWLWLKSSLFWFNLNGVYLSNSHSLPGSAVPDSILKMEEKYYLKNFRDLHLHHF